MYALRLGSLTFGLIFLATVARSQSLTVTPSNATNNTLADIVSSLVGEGVTVSNISSNLGNVSPAFGNFSDPSGVAVGLNDGLILTSGTVLVAEGPNNTTGSGGTNGGGGSALLSALVGGAATNDACIISFDITPSSDTIAFNYVFGSEEYNSFVGSGFNDVFGFFIEGPGITGDPGLPTGVKNIALIPGTTTPVSINNVNKGRALGAGGIVFPSNPGFFINNADPFDPIFNGDLPFIPEPVVPARKASLSYDGITVVLTARVAVQPCQTYRLTLAVADVFDTAFDSGVFIEGGSLRSTGARLEAQSTSASVDYAVEGCNTGQIRLIRDILNPEPIELSLLVGGTATNGVDYLANGAPFPSVVTLPQGVDTLVYNITAIADGLDEGLETIELRVINACDSTPSGNPIVLPIRDELFYEGGADVTFCSGDTVTIGNEAPPLAAFGFAWQTTEGLDDATVATPRLTLTNPTNAPQFFDYVVEVSDSFSTCLITDTLVVRVDPAPSRTVLVPGGDTTICGSTPITLTAETEGANYLWSTNDTTRSIDVTAPGTYFVEISFGGACSVTSDTITVAAGTNIAADAGPDQAGCVALSSVTLGTPANPDRVYAWSPTLGLNNANTAQPTLTLTNDSDTIFTQQYVLSVTDTVSGCTGSDTVVVTVNPEPTAAAVADATFCGVATLPLGTAPALADAQYQWSPATFLSDPTAAQPVFSLTNDSDTTFQQTYAVVVTDTTTGCQSTDSVTMTVNRLPQAAISPTAGVSICATDTLVLSVPEQPGNAYAWSVTGASPDFLAGAAQRVLQVAFDGSASAQIQVLVTDTATGCTNADTVLVTVNPLPNAEAGADTTFCGAATRLLGAPSLTDAQYQWSPAAFLSDPTAAQPVFSLTNNSDTTFQQTYAVLVTDTLTGCQSVDSVTVVVNPLPDATIAQGETANVCAGEVLTLSVPAAAGRSYFWDGNDAPGQSNTITLPFETPGTVLVGVRVLINATGCQSEDTIAVTVDPLPDAQAGTDTTFCGVASRLLGAASLADAQYQWSPVAFLSDPTAAQPLFDLTNDSDTTFQQTYVVLVTDTTTGCQSTDSVTVTVFPAVTAEAGADTAFCGSATRLLGEPASGGFAYAWSPAAFLDDPAAAQPTFSLTNDSDTTFQQAYVVLKTNLTTGCDDTDTVTVTVNPLPLAQAGADLTACAVLIDTLGTVPAVAGAQYQWSPAAFLSDPAAARPALSIVNDSDTTFQQTYTVLVTDVATGCQSTDSVTVTVFPAVTAEAGADTAFCGSATRLLGEPASGGFAYAWSPAAFLDDPAAAQPTFSLTNDSDTTFQQAYVVLKTNLTTGCDDTDTVTVTVNPLPRPVAGEDTTLCADATVVLGAPSVAGLSYQWSPADFLSDPTAAQPVFTLLNEADTTFFNTYVVTATDDATGCQNTDTVTVAVAPPVPAELGPDLALCSGDTLLVGTPTGDGTFGYAWDAEPGLLDPTDPTTRFTAVNVGLTDTTFVLRRMVTREGCTATDSVSITVRPRPRPVALSGPVRICPGTVGATYSLTVPNDSLMGTSYAWSLVGGLGTFASAPSGREVVIDWGAASGVDTLIVQPTSAAGCPGETVRLAVQVNVVLLPEVADYTDTLCLADAQAITYQIVQPNPGSVYTWDVPTAGADVLSGQGTETLTVRWLTAGDFLLEVTESNPTNDTCFGDSPQYPVTILPTPDTLSIVGDVEVCAGDTVSYTYPGTSGLASTFAWSVMGGTVVGENENVVTVVWPTPTPGDTYAVGVTETSAAGCVGPPAELTVDVDPNFIPTIQTATSDTLCFLEAQDVLYTTDYPNAGTFYEWVVTGGTILSNNGTSVRVRWDAPGTYAVALVPTGVNPDTCLLATTDSTDFVVTVLAAPDAVSAIDGPSSACGPTPQTYTVPALPGLTYTWSVSGGNGPAILSGQGTAQITLDPGTVAGPSAPVLLRVVASNNQCPGEATVSMPIIFYPVPVTELVPYDENLCPQNLDSLSYTVTAGLPNSTFDWEVTGGTFAVEDGTNRVVVNWTPNAAAYSLRVTETSEFGCVGDPLTLDFVYDNSAATLRRVTVAPTAPTDVLVSYAVADAANNPAPTAALQRRPLGTPDWETVADVPLPEGTYRDAGLPTDNTAFEYRLLAANRCGDALSSATANTILLGGEALEDAQRVSLDWNLYEGPVAVAEYNVERQTDNAPFDFFAAAALSNALVSEPVATDAFTQTFRVRATTADDSAVFSNPLTLTFENALVVRNVFTPNNDGRNETFEFGRLEAYPNSRLTVVDRFGREVFSTGDYQNDWDGSDNNGNALPAGTYFYRLNTTVRPQTIDGWVQILR